MSQSLPDAALRRSRSGAPAGRPVTGRARRNRRETAAVLAGVPLFAGLSKRHVARLAADTVQEVFEPGRTVVAEGMLGEAMFVVLGGTARVTRRGKRVGAVLPGDFFGELSAIDGGPRSASVVAVTPLRVLRLFRRTLMSLIDDEPQVTLKLLDGIVRRVRQIQRRRER